MSKLKKLHFIKVLSKSKYVILMLIEKNNVRMLRFFIHKPLLYTLTGLGDTPIMGGKTFVRRRETVY